MPADRPDIDPALADAIRRAYARPVDPGTAARHVAAMAQAARERPAAPRPAARPRRHAWRPIAAAGVAVLALPAGLAVAGVHLPRVVDDPYRTVGIKLPHQHHATTAPKRAPHVVRAVPRPPVTTPATPPPAVAHRPAQRPAAPPRAHPHRPIVPPAARPVQRRRHVAPQAPPRPKVTPPPHARPAHPTRHGAVAPQRAHGTPKPKPAKPDRPAHGNGRAQPPAAQPSPPRDKRPKIAPSRRDASEPDTTE